MELSGDSAIEFASGQVTSLAASAELILFGNDAFVQDSTALGSNSALTGLASISAGATFDLEIGASVSTTGPVTDSGILGVDDFSNSGGSTLSIAGGLTRRVDIEFTPLGEI